MFDRDVVLIVQQEVDKMLTQLHGSFAKNFDMFEKYSSQNIFTIPKDINTQPTANNNNLHIPTQDEEEQLDGDIDQLLQRREQLYNKLMPLKAKKGERTANVKVLHDKLKEMGVEKHTAEWAKDLPVICHEVQRLKSQSDSIDSHNV